MNLKKYLNIFFLYSLLLISFWYKNCYSSECYFCHETFKTTFNKTNVHEPIKEKDCKACHKLHGKANRLILQGTIKEICEKCHDLSASEITKQHFGYYINTSSCIKCHNPHASNNKKLIYSFIHAPFKEGKCQECHIKSLDSTKLVLPNSKLCKKCHKEDKTKTKFDTFYHQPYSQGECFICHTPHSTENVYLLKLTIEEICISKCHENILKKHKPTTETKLDMCLVCHSAHFSSKKFLIRAKKK